MKTRTRAALTLLSIMLVCPALQAQQQQVASVGQLREQISKMLTVESDSMTPPEVRELNRELLRERRAQLRGLLQWRLDALLRYRADFKSSLTPDLDKSLGKSINDLITEMHALDTAAEARQQPPTRQRLVRATTAPPPAIPAAREPARADTYDADADADAARAATASTQAQAGTDLVISASKEVTDKSAWVTITNSNRNITSFALFKNGKAVELKESDITIPAGAQEKDVSLSVKLVDKDDETATVKLFAVGLASDNSFVSQSKSHEIKRVVPPKGTPGTGDDDKKKTPGKIKVTEPKDKEIFRDAGALDLAFTVTNPKDDKVKRIPEVFVAVLSNGLPVRQDSEKITLKYDDANDLDAAGVAKLRLAKGSNKIQLFSGYNNNDEYVDLTELRVECRGDRCGLPAADDFSNSMNMRAIVGFEQAGASSADSKTDPFLDLFFFGPLRYGNTCKGQTRKYQKVTQKNAEGEDETTYTVAGLENDPEGCYPTWSSWGNVRFSSIPQQVSAFGTFASNFVSPLAEGKLTELVQGFNFLAGIDRYIGSTDRSFLSPVPGIRHRTSIYLTVGGGASSTLTPQRSAQIFKIPGEDNPQRRAFLDEFFGEGSETEAEYIAFVAPERNKFLRQYYGGFRFKTHFIDRDGYTINRFPSILDVTFGQNEAVTGGKARGVVSRIEGFFPFPLRQASFLYFYGSAFLKLGGKDEIKTPYILETPGSDVRLTDNNVHITTRQYDRDFYRIGIGVNLTELFNRPPKTEPK